MTSSSPPIPLIIYGFINIGAIVFMGVSLGTNYWILLKDRQGTEVAKVGLFEVCFHPNDRCFSISELKSHGFQDDLFADFDHIQGLCITAVVLEAVTLLVMSHLAFTAFLMKTEVQSNNHGVIAVCIACLAGVLAVAGGFYFFGSTGSQQDVSFSSFDNGYSPYLTLVSGAAIFGAGVLAIIANVQMNKKRQLRPQGQAMAPPGVQMGTPMTYAPGAQYSYPAGNQPVAMYPHNPQQGNVVPQQSYNPHQGKVVPQQNYNPQRGNMVPQQNYNPQQGYVVTPPNYNPQQGNVVPPPNYNPQEGIATALPNTITEKPQPY